MSADPTSPKATAERSCAQWRLRPAIVPPGERRTSRLIARPLSHRQSPGAPDVKRCRAAPRPSRNGVSTLFTMSLKIIDPVTTKAIFALPLKIILYSASGRVQPEHRHVGPLIDPRFLSWAVGRDAGVCRWISAAGVRGAAARLRAPRLSRNRIPAAPARCPGPRRAPALALRSPELPAGEQRVPAAGRSLRRRLHRICDDGRAPGAVAGRVLPRRDHRSRSPRLSGTARVPGAPASLRRAGRSGAGRRLARRRIAGLPAAAASLLRQCGVGCRQHAVQRRRGRARRRRTADRSDVFAPGRELFRRRAARHDHYRHAREVSLSLSSPAAARSATASASGAPASPGRASRRSRARPNGRRGRRPPK